MTCVQPLYPPIPAWALTHGQPVCSHIGKVHKISSISKVKLVSQAVKHPHTQNAIFSPVSFSDTSHSRLPSVASCVNDSGVATFMSLK